MKIKLNQRIVDVQRETNLAQIAETEQALKCGHVIALNDCIIPQKSWQQTLLAEGDQISIFSVIAGG